MSFDELFNETKNDEKTTKMFANLENRKRLINHIFWLHEQLNKYEHNPSITEIIVSDIVTTKQNLNKLEKEGYNAI